VRAAESRTEIRLRGLLKASLKLGNC